MITYPKTGRDQHCRVNLALYIRSTTVNINIAQQFNYGVRIYELADMFDIELIDIWK